MERNSLSDQSATALQRELVTLFDRHGLKVAVGLTRHGVAIRSQDPRVDASNIGTVRPAFDEGRER